MQIIQNIGNRRTNSRGLKTPGKGNNDFLKDVEKERIAKTIPAKNIARGEMSCAITSFDFFVLLIENLMLIDSH